MMLQNEIIEMAEKAKFYPSEIGNALESLEAFATLVAAETASKERKEMAEHCVEITRMAVDKAVASAIEKEREACAKVCEGLNLYGGSESRQLQRATLKDCAYAIRAIGTEA
jgi:hypothetical protein